MTGIDTVSAFLVGLAGGVHCIGMCGGIVSALRMASPRDKAAWPYALGYNTGRIISYTLAGALTGAIGQVASSSLLLGSTILSLISAVMLLLMGLYLGNWWGVLKWVEQAGAKLWRPLQPYAKRFIPFKSPLHAVPYGMIWGLLPCGLVYSALTWSMASANAAEGALLMLAFGVGTLPTLMAASFSVGWLLILFRHPLFRQAIALSLCFYGGFLIYSVVTRI